MKINKMTKSLTVIALGAGIALLAGKAGADGTNVPDASQFTIHNVKEDAGDSIDISGLNAGDVVKIYLASDGSELGSVTATGATAQIKGLNLPAGSETIQATVKGAAGSESEKLGLNVGPAPYDEVTVKWNPNDLIITNNAGKADTIVLKNLEPGSVLRVYDKADPASRKLLGQAVVGKNKTEASVTLKEAGGAGNTDGKVYVTVTKEPVATEVIVLGAPKSATPVDITYTNNYLLADTIKVAGLSQGDIVSVYRNDGTTLIGKAAVAKNKTEALVSLKKDTISGSGETVKITVTSLNKRASNPATVVIGEEPTTAKLLDSNVNVTNAAGKLPDKVKVTGVSAGDTITVTGSGVTKVTGKVGKDKTEIELVVKGLATNGGSIDVTVTTPGKKESPVLSKSYDPEGGAVSTAPSVENITVANVAGSDDEVKVSGLAAGDVVKIYKGGALINTTTATDTSVKISLDLASTSAGSIEVSVTSPGKGESPKTAKDFGAEVQRSTALLLENVTIVNHPNGTNDSIAISAGLTNGDSVKIYFVGTDHISTRNAGSSSLNINDINLPFGQIEITVTSAGKLESLPLRLDVPAES
ncbi:hypothetical protein [Cohnella candidum]|uniref:Uncharacterized protein n=1 Tax=Cohnella candidum TaxID=2674991 RepID=A0A3G3K3M3_9BACL|nr:hypothetical protein [Cohnella candidum]AYQ75106.1 hypothetical protein EAV92_22675 [Cohnella candidum]